MRLIKLAAFALFGYALYEFFRGALHDTELGDRLGEAFNRGRSEGQSAFGGNESRGFNISGPGEGESVSTLESDGGSVTHKVGRGVVS